MEERLFYCHVSNGTEWESGSIMTLDELKGELGDKAEDFLSADRTKEGYCVEQGDYNYVFSEFESMDELRETLTGENFDPRESYSVERFGDERFPDFVHPDLRTTNATLEGFSMNAYLPISENSSDTLDRYQQILGISDDELGYTLTPKDKAMAEISDMLDAYDDDDHEELTEEKYNEIVERYGIPEYASQDFTDLVGGIKGPDDGLEQ